MESRFTFKDFVFALLFVVILCGIVWTGYQFSYQEGRLNDVKLQLQQMDATQKQQLGVLAEIRNALRSGVKVSGTGQQPEAATQMTSGIVRRTESDGSIFVQYSGIPSSSRDPQNFPDFAEGDWLVQNLGAEPKVITPLIEKDMQGQMVHTPVLETLVARDPVTLEWVPWLADWYRVSGDGLKLTFHLRAGTCFSDGAPITVEDVLFSFNTLMNVDVDAAPLRSYYDGVTCRKVDDRTVEFTRQEPYFMALEFIGGGIPILPEHVYKFAKGDDFNKMVDVLVASGPYRVEKWDRGQKITLVRNEKYWGPRASMDRIVYVFIGNSQAQMQSFLNEQVDLVSDPIPPDAEEFIRYSQDPEFLKKFIPYRFTRPNSMYMYMGWNLEKPIFKDKETRQALTMLVDRKAIVDKMLRGMGEQMNGPFKIGSPQLDPTVKILPYDLEGAKKKLTEAGWKPGPDGVLERNGQRFEFDLSLRTGVPIRERIATYVQQQFQQAGIRMRLTPYEASVLIARLDDHNFDACLAGWGAGSPEEDPRQIWHSSSIPNKGSNHVSFRNVEADKLIDEGRKIMDPAKRMEIWHKFQHIVYDEQPYMFLYNEADCAFVNGRFKNTQPFPLGLTDYTTYWFVPAALQKNR